MNELPWRRHRPHLHFDNGRPVPSGDPSPERRAQARRVLRPLGRRAEALSKSHKIRVGEIAGDQAIAELFGLHAPHVPEGAVVVPGARAVRAGKGPDWGLSLATPVIVKYRDSRTDTRTELEAWIR